jgi:hypothetical protein
VDGEYVARIEDSDPKRCLLDETPTQLIGKLRQPIPAEPGQRRHSDYEYKRNGNVNLFVFLDASVMTRGQSD